MLGVFNLLPIPPLDGSGVLLSLGGAPVARVFAVIRPFGFLILILLIDDARSWATSSGRSRTRSSGLIFGG